MAKKTQAETTTTVKLLKSCVVGGEGKIIDLEPSQANHLINMGYAEIPSGESGPKNQDTPKD